MFFVYQHFVLRNTNVQPVQPVPLNKTEMIIYANLLLSFIPLTYCILVDSFTIICWKSPFIILVIPGLNCCFYSIFDGKSG